MFIKKNVLALMLALFCVSGGFAQDLCQVDKSKMIPLRDPEFRGYQYVAKLTGSAINGDTDYEIHFDTGSWTTSIPGGALDFSQISIIKKDVYTDWGQLADLVQGQLAVESEDGTVYSIDDFIFYATRNSSTGEYLPDDRTAMWGGTTSILGGFPSVYSVNNRGSFPYQLAEKYAADNMGLGIVSTCEEDISTQWHEMKSYLQVGNTSEINDHLKWRYDVPNWRGGNDFQPEAVPGFKISIDFPNTDERIETANNLLSTVDTGAPDLTLRLTSDDPQYKEPFKSHFVKEGPWVNWNDYYRSDAMTLVNADVTVQFTDVEGDTFSYSFPVGENPYETPNSLYAGRWQGNVPWPYANPSFTRNRINLGNTVYFNFPVYYWDIKYKRIGIGPRPDITETFIEEEIINNAESFSLLQNYPNPFNPTTNIGFELARESTVSLTVYDLMGREVAVLINNKRYSSGSYQSDWDGSSAPSGIYIYKLTAGDFYQTRKMLLIK